MSQNASEEKLRSGWTYLVNSPKWHYFTSEANRSLCGRFMLLSLGELEQGKDDHPQNCKKCMEKLKKRSQTPS